jgi:hypothetical protein
LHGEPAVVDPEVIHRVEAVVVALRLTATQFHKVIVLQSVLEQVEVLQLVVVTLAAEHQVVVIHLDTETVDLVVAQDALVVLVLDPVEVLQLSLKRVVV